MNIKLRGFGKSMKNKINKLFENSDRNFNLTVFWLTIILFVYCYFGSFSFFEKTFNSLLNMDYWKIIYHNTMSFILFFCGSVIFSRYALKSKTTQFGLSKGNAKLGLKLCALATIVVPIIALTTVFDSGMTSTYPLVDLANLSWHLIALYYISYLLYYVGWEYLFRGLGLFATEKKLGIMGAVLFTTLISAIVHTSIGGFGKPMIETLSAIPAGIIFALIAYSTHSIWYTVYIHFIIGALTDIAIFLLS